MATNFLNYNGTDLESIFKTTGAGANVVVRDADIRIGFQCGFTYVTSPWGAGWGQQGAAVPSLPSNGFVGVGSTQVLYVGHPYGYYDACICSGWWAANCAYPGFVNCYDAAGLDRGWYGRSPELEATYDPGHIANLTTFWATYVNTVIKSGSVIAGHIFGRGTQIWTGYYVDGRNSSASTVYLNRYRITNCYINYAPINTNCNCNCDCGGG